MNFKIKLLIASLFFFIFILYMGNINNMGIPVLRNDVVLFSFIY